MAETTIAEQCAVLRRRLDDLRAAARDADRLRADLADMGTAIDYVRRRADELDRECRFIGELLQLAPEGHVITDAVGTIRRVNHAATKLLDGSAGGNLVGRSLDAFAVGDDRSVVRCEIDRLRRPPEPDHELNELRARLRSLAGREFQAGLTVALAPDDPAGDTALHWSMRDITDRMATEQSLRRNEARLRAVLDTAFSGMISTDEGGTVDSVNRAAERMFGAAAADLVGRPLADLFPAVQADGDLSADDHGQVGAVRELTGWRPEGTTFSAELVVGEGRGDGRRFFTAIIRDTTDLTRARERALRAERLAAIGQMVAGLAHESRNALQRGQAALERIEGRVADRPEAAALLAELQRSQDDLHRLFEEVRHFSAPVRLDVQNCHLADAWRAAWASLAAARAGRHAELREVGDVTAAACAADPFRLEQAFRNVFANALEAAPGPVRVTVGWELATLAGAAGRPRHSLRRSRVLPGSAAECVRTVLHDQGKREGPGDGHRPPDRRGPRGHCRSR